MRGILTAILTVALALAGCSPVSEPRSASEAELAAVTVPHATYRNLAYGHLSSEQRLDLYVPKSGQRPFPLIVYLHGGGYARGTKEMMPRGLREEALARGYAVASVDYRLLRQAPFPAQIDDVIASIQWLRSNAATYSIDPDRVVTWGFSAGGHLAVLAGMAGGRERLSGPRGANWGRAPVKAVVDWAGPANFYEMEKYLSRRGQIGPHEGGLARMTQDIANNPQLLEWAEPLAHADPEDPPVLIEHGSRDRTVPVSQALELAKGLSKEIGANKVELHILRRAGHNLNAYATPHNLKRAFAWVDSKLGREGR